MPILVTRLFDGSSVQLSGPKVERGVQVKPDALEQEGCEVILLLCTGRFRGLQCRQCWLLQPYEIIPPMAAGLLRHPCSGSSCRSLRKYIRKGANGAASGDRRS